MTVAGALSGGSGEPSARASSLDHVDPELWFDGRLVSFGGHRVSTAADDEPIPGVVARAREEFAEILFRDELARAG